MSQTMRMIAKALLAGAVLWQTLAADPVPDFSLKDVSYSSPRRGNPVSPRDYLMQVSAWYFGEAT
jgi:hypothetical protein